MDPFLLNEKMVRFFQRRNAASFREIFPSRKTHELVGAFQLWKCRRSFWSFPKLRFLLLRWRKNSQIYTPKWWGPRWCITTVKVKVKTPNKQTQKKKKIFFGQALISRREAAMIFLWYCIFFSQHWHDVQVSMGPFDPHNPSKLSMTSYAQFNNHPMNLLVHHHCALKLPKKWLILPSWMEKNKTYHPYHH